MSAHSHGKWEVDFIDEQIIRIDYEDLSTVIVPRIWLDDETSIADAHLIAAAPDLLEALEYALPYLKACVPSPKNGLNADGSVDVNCVDRAIRAIAKAKGQ